MVDLAVAADNGDDENLFSAAMVSVIDDGDDYLPPYIFASIIRCYCCLCCLCFV